MMPHKLVLLTLVEPIQIPNPAYTSPIQRIGLVYTSFPLLNDPLDKLTIVQFLKCRIV